MPTARRTAPPVLVLISLWLLLRLGLAWHGGSFAESRPLDLHGHTVSALLLRADSPSKTRPLLVALHGGLAAKETLLPLCWEANRRGADCVTLDALGHGASSRLPLRDTLSRMRSVLHVESLLDVPAAQTAFVGHSMGAHLGCGAVFPCSRCVAIGQPVRCEPSRIVYGTLHQQLGLPRAFYLPISHVLEPWTPVVIDATLDRLLPATRSQHAAQHIAVNVALAWCSLAVMAIAGLLLSRIVRSQVGMPPALRGALAALALWSLIALASWRTLWWLVPTQRTDLLIALPLIAAAWLLARIGQALGLRQPGWGVLFAALLSELAALLCHRLFPVAALQGLLLLPIGLLLPVLSAVAACERLSRSQPDSTEAAVFSATLLGICLALLVPGL